MISASAGGRVVRPRYGREERASVLSSLPAPTASRRPMNRRHGTRARSAPSASSPRQSSTIPTTARGACSSTGPGSCQSSSSNFSIRATLLPRLRGFFHPTESMSTRQLASPIGASIVVASGPSADCTASASNCHRSAARSPASSSLTAASRSQNAQPHTSKHARTSAHREATCAACSADGSHTHWKTSGP